MDYIIRDDMLFKKESELEMLSKKHSSDIESAEFDFYMNRITLNEYKEIENRLNNEYNKTVKFIERNSKSKDELIKMKNMLNSFFNIPIPKKKK